MPQSTHSTSAQRLGPFAGLLGWTLGTAAQLQQPALWPWWAYALPGCLGLVMALCWWGWRWYSARLPLALRAAGWLLALALLAFAGSGLRSLAFAAGALEPSLEGQDLRVTGVVTELPQRNEAGLRFTLAVESALLSGKPVQLPELVDVGWYANNLNGGDNTVGDVRAGERWRFTLRPKAPHGSRNPFGFDYELWLWERGVQATAYVRTGAQDAPPQRLGQTYAHPVALMRQSVRARIFAAVEQRQVAGLIAALVVGDQAAIDKVDWDVFRATGVAHLVSISGLHITMFAWGASWLVGWLWRRSARLCQWRPAPEAALLGGVLLAFAYSLFSGWGIPAQRTCLMLAAVAVLRLGGRRWPWPQTWMLTCSVVVASDPWALLQAGFWLSFVAVGVLFAVDPGHTPEAREPHWWQAWLGRARGLLQEQWVVTVALAPLTLLLFGQLSLVGLVANAFAIPWVTLVLTPLAMLGVLWPMLWGVASGATAVLMGLLQALAALPGATLSLAVAPWWLAGAGVLGGVLLVARFPWHVRLLGLPLLLPVLLWKAAVPPMGEFELLAADIGQGNAVLLRTAHHALLYDAGPRYSLESDAGHRVLLPLLQALQTRLDTVVLSHRDTDHIGGAQAVLAMQPQATLLTSMDAADERLQGMGATQRHTRCEAGQHWQWEGVRFDILHPQSADYGTAHSPNAVSCVLRVQSATGRVALLVGDIERPQEEALLRAQAPLHADVLLVPHHGSKTSSSEAFLDAVSPRLAWIQAGYRNRYGHPVEAVVQRYLARGIVVRDSPHCGAMRWSSSGIPEGDCLRTVQRHYWSHPVP